MMIPLIKNILIATALTGAGIFIYNKWIKTDDATEKKLGADGGCGCSESNITGKRKYIKGVLQHPAI